MEIRVYVNSKAKIKFMNFLPHFEPLSLILTFGFLLSNPNPNSRKSNFYLITLNRFSKVFCNILCDFFLKIHVRSSRPCIHPISYFVQFCLPKESNDSDANGIIFLLIFYVLKLCPEAISYFEWGLRPRKSTYCSWLSFSIVIFTIKKPPTYFKKYCSKFEFPEKNGLNE